MQTNERVMTPEDVFSVLQGDTYKSAERLHKLGERLKLTVRLDKNKDNYRISYNQHIPRRAVFTLECGESGSFRVLASLENAQKYPELLTECPENVKNIIKSTRKCTGCNPQCYDKAVKLNLDGQEYLLCIVNGHIFENLNQNEWEAVGRLLEEDSKY